MGYVIKMETINIKNLSLSNLKLICANGSEAKIYRDCQVAYKIFKSGRVDLKAKSKKIEILSEITLNGLICPSKKIVEDDLIGYSMNYIDGKYIHNLKFRTTQMITLFKTISNLLKLYHENGIILSDINPKNILVKSPEEVYFCDVDSCSINGIDSDTIPYITYKFLEHLGIDGISLSASEDLDNLSTYLVFLYVIFNKMPFYKLSDYEIDKILIQKGFFVQRELVKKLKYKLVEVPYIGDML